MKFTVPGILFILLLSSCTKPEQSADLSLYIVPMIGTDSRFELSNGNTYPAIALPWGMNFWTPQTNEMGNGWCYQYCSDKIRGIKQTHQASPWLNDYGAFSFFALTNKLVIDENESDQYGAVCSW